MLYTVLLFIRAPFCILLVFVATRSVFWLFWLSCQYLPSDWLERPLGGSLIVARGSSPESRGRRVLMMFLFYCIASISMKRLNSIIGTEKMSGECYVSNV